MYHSEHGQDCWLEENIFKGKRNGVFVEFGAIDGLLYSNTLFFEREREWDGLLIEANPRSFCGLLDSGRRAAKVGVAIGQTHGVHAFTEVASITGWSGLSIYMDPRHDARIWNEGVATRTFYVPVLPLADVLRSCGLHQIDYMSIDVEGAELAILGEFPFADFDIDVIEVENNYGERFVEAVMAGNNYSKIHTLEINDIYRRI